MSKGQARGGTVRLKRVYDPPDRTDGLRVLVDRLWPRGLSRQSARVDEWRRDVAPTDALRKWYGHDPAKWPGFRRRYLAELKKATPVLRALARQSRRTTVTLVFAARDVEHSNAAVLRSLLERLTG